MRYYPTPLPLMKVKYPTMRKTLALIFILSPLFACSTLEFPGVYKLPIEQGNIVTEEMVSQLEPGMSTGQVEFVLGTPLIRDSFTNDRWDYLYVLQNPDDSVEKQRLTVYFDNGVLSHYESTVVSDKDQNPPVEPMEEGEFDEAEGDFSGAPRPPAAP